METEGTVVPFAWDPKNPYALAFVAVAPSSGTGARGGATVVPGASLQRCTPLPGIGCSDPELAALGSMVDGTCAFYEARTATMTPPRQEWEVRRQLLRLYRRHLRQCLEELSSTDAMETENDDRVASRFNLEMLKVSDMVLHISDIFLHTKWNEPGRVTADFCRYLRLQHYDPPLQSAEYREVHEAVQPEGYGSRFWALVEGLIVHGCLVQAWDLLQRHSLYQRALDRLEPNSTGADHPWEHQRAAAIKRAFETVREIMSRAPLPGGRDLDLDAAMSLGLANESLEDDDMDTFYSDELPVSPSTYRLWDFSDNATLGDGRTPMFMHYHSEIMEDYRKWQDYVKKTRQSLNVGSVPELARILAILSGDLDDYEFTYWSEALLADLLYRKPNVEPRDLSKRARKFMRLYTPDALLALEPILNIMEGNFSKAIQLLYVHGGGGGAALPATITALVGNLFRGKEIPQSNAEDLLPIYLVDAAAAIVASIPDADVGVPLAVRLLMPFAMHHGNRNILATICELMAHYVPASDADAKALLSVVRPLIEMKSVCVLESCSDLILARYRSHRGNHGYTEATEWLLQGWESEASFGQSGSCCRVLLSLCSEMTTALLKAAASERNESILLSDYLTIKQVTDALMKNPQVVETVSEVKMLWIALSIYEKIIENEDSYSDYPSKEIVEALRGITDPFSGVRTTIAEPRFYPWLLNIAQAILASEESKDSDALSSFQKEGLAVLSETLLRVRTASSLEQTLELTKLEKLILHARGRAEVLANAQLKSRHTAAQWETPELSRIRSVGLEKYDKDTQEAVVRLMLEF